MQTPYAQLLSHLKPLGHLNSISALLNWDERTQLPPKGAEFRAEQLSLLAKLRHESFTDPRIGDLLSQCESSDLTQDPDSDPAVNIRETRRSYDRATKLPTSLVEELAKTEVLAQHAWVDARKRNDYPAFEPWLAKTLDLKRQQAECYLAGATSTGHPKTPTVARASRPCSHPPSHENPSPNHLPTSQRYDALLDDFEPGETAANLERVFAELRATLVPLVAAITSSPKKAPVEILERHYPAAQQEQLAKLAAAAVGFDFSAGRLDTSVHPFSTGIAPGDTRITTRYDEHYFGDAFFGTLHEAGHAMYSQGLPPHHFGTPRGDDISLGIHESQSRMWENLVGRSKSFWTFFLPKAKELFPTALRDVSLDQFHFAVNDVRPSLIRTEADEATYNLHVMLRFELEQALLDNHLSTKDLPAAWNAKMRQYLGLTPPDDAKGCLQDIHWSGGSIGYFPTYTLGNLYAAQFFDQAKKDLGDLDAHFSKGDFTPLLSWLRQNIHSQGKRHRAPALVQKITHNPLSATPLLNHLKRNAADLYGVPIGPT